jgi:hypothetical protein
MHAQFIVLPPLTKIAEFFVKATGAPTFYAGAEWFTWNPVMPDDIEPFRRYIRPSHQALINAAVSTPQDATRICAFLRQLLRPHQFKIDTRGGHDSTAAWVLVFTGPIPDASGGEVIRKEGVLVTWE